MPPAAPRPATPPLVDQLLNSWTGIQAWAARLAKANRGADPPEADPDAAADNLLPGSAADGGPSLPLVGRENLLVVGEEGPARMPTCWPR